MAAGGPSKRPLTETTVGDCRELAAPGKIAFEETGARLPHCEWAGIDRTGDCVRQRIVHLALCLLALLAAPAMAIAQTAPGASGSSYVVRFDHWTDRDERDFSEFISAIGQSNCRTVDECLHGAGNPFRASDPPGIRFTSDCANLPYVLRAYFAWKRGLPAHRSGAWCAHDAESLLARWEELPDEQALGVMGAPRARAMN